jgi:SAM-dependent methyltransferase
VHSTARGGYGRAAETYAQSRPSYPDGAVDWLLDGLCEPAKVVEVGAGTGKFTAQLVERAVEVLAVEPVRAMRDRLPALGPCVIALDATAERLPFGSASVPALIASQSLHWTDIPAALAEFDRVLVPSGGIGLIWNYRDIEVAWQRDLDTLLTELRGDAPHSRDGRWECAVDASIFSVVSSAAWRWSVPTDQPGVVARVRSVSYVAVMPEEAQRRVDERVGEILRDHGLDARAEGFGFPYVTEAYIVRRRAEDLT